MVPTIANFVHFKDQNTHFAPWSNIIILSGYVFIPYHQQKVGRGLSKHFLDFKIGFSWIGEALIVPTIANFDHFKDQNTLFAPWSNIIMLSGYVFIP